MTTSVVASIPKFQFFDASGNPLVGGKLETYLAGSSTPVITYQDEALSAQNATTIVLDSRGECLLWLDSTKNYKFILKTAADATLWTVDNITNSTAFAQAISTALAASTGSSLIGYISPGADATATTLKKRLDQKISVLDYINNDALGLSGADPATGRPALTVDWTSAIQAAVDYATVVSTDAFVGDGAPCTVFFPAGLYDCYGTVTLTGAVAVEGDGNPISFGGSFIRVQGASHALFKVANNVPSAVYFTCISMRGNGATPTGAGLFEVTEAGGAALANSFYFVDCWFQVYEDYALKIAANMDDFRLINCTLDVSDARFVLLGATNKPVINSIISGCTFYTGSEANNSLVSFIEIAACTNLIIANNKFYANGSGSCATAITGLGVGATNVIITGNTCDEIDVFCNISGDSWTVTNNVVTGGNACINIGGTAPYHLTIADNYLEGSSGGTFGIIEAAGLTSLNFSSITNNNINGIAPSAAALRIPAGSYIGKGNLIQDNVVRGCTVNGTDGQFTFTPVLFGLSTAGTFTYATRSGFYRLYGGVLTIDFLLTLSAIGVAPTGEVVVAGLPIVSARSSRGSALMYDVTYPAGATNYMATIPTGEDYVRILFTGTGSVLAGLQPADLTANTTIAVTISYFI